MVSQCLDSNYILLIIIQLLNNFSFISGCNQNYHKRCVIKIPNNCSRSNDVARMNDVKRTQPNLSPSKTESSNTQQEQTTMLAESECPKSDTNISLVKRMSELMSDIINN